MSFLCALAHPAVSLPHPSFIPPSSLQCLRDGEVTVGGLNYCNWEDSWVMPTLNSTQVVQPLKRNTSKNTCQYQDSCKVARMHATPGAQPL